LNPGASFEKDKSGKYIIGDDVQIAIIFVDVNQMYKGYDCNGGGLFKENRECEMLYDKVTVPLSHAGVDIKSDFLSYAFLGHCTNIGQLKAVIPRDFNKSNRDEVTRRVNEKSVSNPSSFIDPLWNTDDLIDIEKNWNADWTSGYISDNSWHDLSSYASNSFLSMSNCSYTFSTGYTYHYDDFIPIGAFYEAINPAADTAPSIADRTPVLLDSGNHGLLDAGELKTLTQANITTLDNARGDYRFYTQGNGQPGTGVAAAPGVSQTAPAIGVLASNFRSLRDTNNHRTIAMGTIEDEVWIINGRRVGEHPMFMRHG
jgi:hypothetical protein